MNAEKQYKKNESTRLVQTKQKNAWSNFTNNNPIHSHQKKISDLIQKSNIKEGVIQKVDFPKFIKSMQNEKDKELTIYTHVVGDGYGDIGMVNNLESIFNNKKNELKINTINKIATYDTDSERKNKKEIMLNSRFKEIIETEPVKYPPRGVRKRLERKFTRDVDNIFEIQSPVFDMDSHKEFNNCNNFTTVVEMGKSQSFGLPSNTTLSKKSDYLDVGFILPQNEEGFKDGDVETIFLDFIYEDNGDRTNKLKKFKTNKPLSNPIALVNIRDCNSPKKGLKASLSFFIRKLHIKKVIQIKAGGVSIYNDLGIQVYSTNTIHSGVLKHLLTKLDSNSLVMAGGEGLFSEALGLGKAMVSLTARYAYQYAALLVYGREHKYKHLIEPLILRSLDIIGYNEDSEEGISLEKLNEHLALHGIKPPLDSKKHTSKEVKAEDLNGFCEMLRNEMDINKTIESIIAPRRTKEEIK